MTTVRDLVGYGACLPAGLGTAGFRIEASRDTTTAGRAFFGTVLARIAESGPPPRPDPLLTHLRPRAENMLRGSAEEGLAVLAIVCRKP
jgi:hypothetical protein